MAVPNPPPGGIGGGGGGTIEDWVPGLKPGGRGGGLTFNSLEQSNEMSWGNVDVSL